MANTAKTRLAAVRGDPFAWSAAALLLLSLILGGGGAEAPILNGFLEACGGILMCAAIAAHFTSRPFPDAATVPVAFLAAALLLVALQLLPLPPSVWRDLPGREAAVAALEVSGGASQWRPLSLDPEATRRMAAGLLLPAGLLLATLHARHQGLVIMTRAIVIGALISAILAAAQVALGLPESLYPYGAPGAAVPTGIFANPNHQAQLMLAGLVASGLLIRLGNPQIRIRRAQGSIRFHFGWLLFPVFIVSTIAVQSRAGLLLLLPALAAATMIALDRRGLARIFGVSIAAFVGLCAIVALLPGSLERSFELQSELSAGGRLTHLPDILYTLEQFRPWGSGFGTFVPVFKANENLDLMGDAFLNHAHNDLLELLIEGGLPAALLLVAIFSAMAIRLWRLITTARSTEPAPALAGLAILVLVLLHSLVDYPLRTDALAAVAGAALGLFVSSAQRRDQAPAKGNRRSRGGFAKSSHFAAGLSRPGQGSR